jgi:hypothetical protein
MYVVIVTLEGRKNEEIYMHLVYQNTTVGVDPDVWNQILINT